MFLQSLRFFSSLVFGRWKTTQQWMYFLSSLYLLPIWRLFRLYFHLLWKSFAENFREQIVSVSSPLVDARLCWVETFKRDCDAQRCETRFSSGWKTLLESETIWYQYKPKIKTNTLTAKLSKMLNEKENNGLGVSIIASSSSWERVEKWKTVAIVHGTAKLHQICTWGILCKKVKWVWFCLDAWLRTTSHWLLAFF